MDSSSPVRFPLPGAALMILTIAGAILLGAPAASAYTFGEPGRACHRSGSDCLRLEHPEVRERRHPGPADAGVP